MSKSKNQTLSFTAKLAFLASKVFNREATNPNSSELSSGSHIVGTPGINAMEMDGAQSQSHSCAIKAQELILERYTNSEISEQSLIQYATEKGWYIEGGGTSMSDVGNLIEEAGIPVSRRHGATIFDLYKELAEGKQVIIGVDGAELRGDDPLGEFLEEFYEGDKPDHAVVVSGINARTNQVMITDPATGLTQDYSFEQLTDAWGDSNFFMMNTNIPAPKWVPGMEDFDYSLGHISSIQDVSFDSYTEVYSSLLVEPQYSSIFDLTNFLEVAPHSYGALLSEWSVNSPNDFPINWGSLCMSDSEWIAEVADSADYASSISEISTQDGFFDAACDIFNSLS